MMRWFNAFIWLKAVSHRVEIELLKLTTRLAEMNYNISFDDSVKEFISSVGFDEKYGARPIKRAIQEKIEDLISEEVLRGTITENDPFVIDMLNEDELQLNPIPSFFVIQ